MKLNQNFIYRKIASEDFILPIGSKVAEFHGIISLNETAAFIVKALQTDQNFEDLVLAVVKEYKIDQEAAVKDVQNVIGLLIRNGLIS